MAGTRRLNDLIEGALSRARLPDGDVTVALSGGADSAALAHLCAISGASTRAVHVHHGYPASDALADAAQKISGSLGIPIHTIEVQVSSGASPEERARDVRYQALLAIDGPVLTAHTRDDNVETVLINLIRGSGPDGLGGIPDFRPPNVHRPILQVTRSETREIATLAGLDFLDDPMNRDQSLTRNRIRMRLLPVLREFNPSIDEAISRAAAAIRDEIADADEAAAGVTIGGDLPVSVMAALPRPVAMRVMRRWLTANEVAVSADTLARVWSVVDGESTRQELNGGRSVVRREAILTID